MAIPATYAALQTTIAAYAHRTGDTTFTDYVVDFISMAEARLYDMLILKDMEAEDTLTLSVGVNYVALPSSYISPIALWLVISTERVLLDMALPQELQYSTNNGQPRYWAIDGVNIRFDCPASSAYTAYLRSVKKSNLSVSNTSNQLLLRRPDIYIAGALAAGARFTQNDKLFATWEPVFLAGCKEVMAAEARNRNQVPLRSEVATMGRSGNIIRGY